MSRNVAKCREMSKNVEFCRILSNFVEVAVRGGPQYVPSATEINLPNIFDIVMYDESKKFLGQIPVSEASDLHKLKSPNKIKLYWNELENFNFQ